MFRYENQIWHTLNMNSYEKTKQLACMNSLSFSLMFKIKYDLRTSQTISRGGESLNFFLLSSP